MCGIVAVVGRPSDRVPPLTSEILTDLQRAAEAAEAAGHGWSTAPAALERAADTLHTVDQRLRGTAGVRSLLGDRAAMDAVDRAAEDLDGVVAKLEDRIDADATFNPTVAASSTLGLGRGGLLGEVRAVRGGVGRGDVGVGARLEVGDALLVLGAVAELAGLGVARGFAEGETLIERAKRRDER